MTVERIDAIALSGGSAFGLDAAARRAGLAARAGPRLRDRATRACRSCRARSCSTCSTAATRIGAAFRPIASSAMRPRRGAAQDFALGSAGAGLGATTVNLKGGIGSASATTPDGITVGALAAVNAAGSVTIGDGPHFWAGAVRSGRRIRRARPARRVAAGRARVPDQGPAPANPPRSRWSRPTRLYQGAGASGSPSWRRPASRARSIRSTRRSTATSCSRPQPAKRRWPIPLLALSELGALAANVLARAVARGVYEANALPFSGALPDWKSKFGDFRKNLRAAAARD